MTHEPPNVDNNAVPRQRRFKLVAAALLLLAIAAVSFTFRESALLEWLAAREAQLKSLQQQHAAIVFGLAFLLYVTITGLSLPGATPLTLLYAWLFDFWPAVVLVSFASTTGATIAFLLSRYLFRDAVRRRFGGRLEGFNQALDREGAFYLFTLRLIPAAPFFVINAVMGLTNLRVWTFWWVSQVGMLAGTMVYVYAGSRIPDLQTLSDRGMSAVFSPWQFAQILAALALLGAFPLAVKKLLGWLRPQVM